MKIHPTLLGEVAVALTMLSCTTPTSTPTTETTQPTSGQPFSHSGPSQGADWEAGRAWQKEHMKTGAMSRL
jgi:hypothetical protein